jgi:hypothetical protein
VKPTGEYIIFAAGTGVLCYLDLLTQLALSLLGVDRKINAGLPLNSRESKPIQLEQSLKENKDFKLSTVSDLDSLSSVHS